MSNKEQQQAKKRTASRLIGPAVAAYKKQCGEGAKLVESAQDLIEGDMYVLPPTAAQKADYLAYPNEYYAVMLSRAMTADHQPMFPKGGIREAAIDALMAIDDAPFKAVYEEIVDAFGERLVLIKEAKESGLQISADDEAYYKRKLKEAEARGPGGSQADGRPVESEPDMAEALGNSGETPA